MSVAQRFPAFCFNKPSVIHTFPRQAWRSLARRKEPTSLLFALASISVRGTSSAAFNMERPAKVIALDDFARRQWKVNEIYNADPTALKDGYAPFCKHLFVPCFLQEATVEAIAITDANRHLLRSDYEARKPEELPVLVRWFPKEAVEAQQAKYLDLILYSREQLIEENKAMGGAAAAKEEEEKAPWGLISIKAQLIDYEIPMQPITMMRNALGKDQGGSGVPLEAAKYRQSVAYWAAHATIA